MAAARPTPLTSSSRRVAPQLCSELTVFMVFSFLGVDRGSAHRVFVVDERSCLAQQHDREYKMQCVERWCLSFKIDRLAWGKPLCALVCATLKIFV